jgi:hypothetical protein
VLERDATEDGVEEVDGEDAQPVLLHASAVARGAASAILRQPGYEVDLCLGSAGELNGIGEEPKVL